MKTGYQIQSDFLALFNDTELPKAIQGNVYREGMRPRDSASEDMVVIFTTADADQFQQGVVTVNVFVPFIYPYDNGVAVENGARCAEIEEIAQRSVETLTAVKSNYRIRLHNAIHTLQDESISQSFVVIALDFTHKD